MDSDPGKSFSTIDTGSSLLLILFVTGLCLIGATLLPGNFLAHPLLYASLTAIVGFLLFFILAEFFFFRLPSSIAKPFYYLSLSFNWVFERLTDLTMQLLRLKPAKELEPGDLMQYITGEEEEPVEEGDVAREILQKAVDFPGTRVHDCMTPRTEIVAIDENESIDAARELFIKSGHSKLPVYKESIDEVTGYIHLIDLFHRPETVDQMVMPIIVASDSMPASDLLKQLIDKHRSIAVVVDEFGGTAGLITIEDILEEIVGEIQDEHDVGLLLERKEKEGEYYFSARLEIDYLNETYKLLLPKNPEYETLAGLVFYYFQNIPKPGDTLRLPPYELKVVSMDGNRIDSVRISDRRVGSSTQERKP